MAFMDETNVVTRLNAAAKGTDLEFYVESPYDDDGDAEVCARRAGVKVEHLAFQVGGGYVCLNRYGHETPGVSASFFMQQLGDWGVQPQDLDALFPAFQAALESAL